MGSTLSAPTLKARVTINEETEYFWRLRSTQSVSSINYRIDRFKNEPSKEEPSQNEPIKIQDINTLGFSASLIHREMWYQAENFTDLLQLNQIYVSGSGKVDYRNWLPPSETAPIDCIGGILRRLNDLGLFAYNGQEYATLKYIWARPYLSFWCPESTKPLELISKLRERPDIIIYASKLHPFEVVQRTPAEPTSYVRRKIPSDISGSNKVTWEEDKGSSIEAFDISKDSEFWNLECVRREGPWLIDVVVNGWDFNLDLVDVIKEAIEQCGWSKVMTRSVPPSLKPSGD